MAMKSYSSLLIIIIMMICNINKIETRKHRGLSGSPGMLLRDLLNNPQLNSGSDSEDTDNEEEADPFPFSSTASLSDIRDSLASKGIADQEYEKPSAKFLIDLYNRLQQGLDLKTATGMEYEEKDLAKSDTIRSFGSQVPAYKGRSEVTLMFNLSSISSNERTQLAELRLSAVRPDSDSGSKNSNNRRKRRLQKMKVALIQDGARVKQMTYRVASTEQDNEEVDSFDLTRVVKDIVESGFRNVMVRITLKYKKNRSQDRSTRSIHETTEPTDAMLVVFSQDKHFLERLEEVTKETIENERMKRDLNIQAKRQQKKEKKAKKPGTCGMEDFEVDFEAIGWGEWIVYPKRFNAKVCNGRCPLPVDQHFDPTNHAVMQSLMRLKNKNSAPRPCCVPSKLHPLSMLYYEYGEIVVRHHEDMIVGKCGCR